MNFLKKHEQPIIAIVLVLINFLIKGIFLSSNSLGGDEPFSVYHAQMDIVSIIKLLSEGNNPPLFEIILNLWIKIFGISEFSVRFPSLIFSSITVLYIYKFGTKYLNKRIALYASIIFIFSNYHILFAHEARVYSLLGLLSVVSMYNFMGVLHHCSTDIIADDKQNKVVRKKIITLIIINTLIIYSHYFGFFILITQFIFFIFNKTLILKYWKQLLMYSSIIGILYLPNISVVLYRFIESSSNGTWVKTPNGIYSIIDMLRLFTNNPYGENCFEVGINNAILKGLLKAPVTIFSIFIIGIAIIRRLLSFRDTQTTLSQKLVAFWFAFPFLLIFSISYIVPIFLDRYLMPAAVAFCIFLAISSDYIMKAPRHKCIIPVIVSLLFIITVKPNISNKRNVEETIDKIKEIKDSNTLVIICPSHFILNYVYYYNQDIFKDYNTNEIYSNINKSMNLEDVYGVNSINEIDYKKWNKIVFLDAAANFSFPNNNIKHVLDASYDLINKYHFNEIFIIFEYKSK